MTMTIARERVKEREKAKERDTNTTMMTTVKEREKVKERDTSTTTMTTVKEREKAVKVEKDTSMMVMTTVREKEKVEKDTTMMVIAKGKVVKAGRDTTMVTVRVKAGRVNTTPKMYVICCCSHTEMFCLKRILIFTACYVIASFSTDG